jgi:hypothetical protein
VTVWVQAERTTVASAAASSLVDAAMVEINPLGDRSNSVGRVSIFASATGIGSWPGSSAREAAEVVVGELHTLPHLVELPARGVGADTIGVPGRTRPLCAYPGYPRYSGSGDIHQAASFSCAQP